MLTVRRRADEGWQRIVQPSWSNPLDASFSRERGGRWNAPGQADTLYLNGNYAAVVANLRAYTVRWGYEPDELDPDLGPDLVTARLPYDVVAVDLVSDEGLAEVGLPNTYPAYENGDPISHDVCQLIGGAVRVDGHEAIECRCAETPAGDGRELAWFPPGGAEAVVIDRRPFPDWYV